MSNTIEIEGIVSGVNRQIGVVIISIKQNRFGSHSHVFPEFTGHIKIQEETDLKPGDMVKVRVEKINAGV